MTRLNRIMQWLLGASTLAVLALFCWHALDLYLIGTLPDNLSETGVLLSPIFSWENVGARLILLRPWLIGYVILLTGCLVLHASASRPAALRLRADDETLLRLRKKAVGFLPENAIGLIGLPAQAVREELFRRRMRIGMTLILLPMALIAASYLLNRENFTSWDLESVLSGMLLPVALPCLIMLAAGCFITWQTGRSIRRELTALQGMPSVRQTSGKSTSAPSHSVTIIRAVLLTAAMVMIIDGILNGGLRDVLIKAINICTECIGLG